MQENKDKRKMILVTNLPKDTKSKYIALGDLWQKWFVWSEMVLHRNINIFMSLNNYNPANTVSELRRFAAFSHEIEWLGLREGHKNDSGPRPNTTWEQKNRGNIRIVAFSIGLSAQFLGAAAKYKVQFSSLAKQS